MKKNIIPTIRSSTAKCLHYDKEDPLCCSPAYLSMKNKQLVIKLPEVEKNGSLPESLKKQAKLCDNILIIFAF